MPFLDLVRDPHPWRWPGCAFLGAGLAFAAMPPWNLWPLAWLAAAAWATLVRLPLPATGRPYLILWLAGMAYWVATLFWLRLPYWATGIGGLFLCAYLACYLPLFVALSRLAVSRWQWHLAPAVPSGGEHAIKFFVVPMRWPWPLALAVPCVWTGLEMLQAHLFSGFSLGNLAHSQYRWLALIQIADLTGAYGVSFVLFCVGACLASVLPLDGPWRWRPLLPAAILVAAACGYGAWRLAAPPGPPGARVALLQGSIDTVFTPDPTRDRRMLTQYRKLLAQARAQGGALDLILWPESMFPLFNIQWSEGARPRADETWTVEDLPQIADKNRAALERLTKEAGTSMLVGVSTYVFGADERAHFNSAQLVHPTTGLGARYDKMHLVMFGEYVPLANWLPWLYDFTPLDGGLDAGQNPSSMQIGPSRVATSICFETCVPHFIRGTVHTLADRGEEPDLLLNLTNDGWFWGSSELDLHLMCGVFRAVECRKPLLIAANTGFSAHVDGSGRILQRGPRRATGVLICEPRHDTRRSLYVAWGDVFAGTCLAMCAGLVLIGVCDRWLARRLLGRPA